MDTSVTNTCSSSIVNTNIIPKTKHKILQKNKREKTLSLKLLTSAEKIKLLTG